SPLKFTAEPGSVDILKLLFKHPNIDPNWKGHDQTPLAHDIMNGHLEVVGCLLQCTDIQPDIPCRTPLMIAAMKGCESLFHLLFESHKVTKDLVSAENVSLLACAVCGGNHNIVDQVLELTSSSGCKGCRLCTPLSYAAVEGYQDVVRLLLVVQKIHSRPFALPVPR
ncbi:ankyrin repeat-containing domain protein, partial [Mycena floridula]